MRFDIAGAQCVIYWFEISIFSETVSEKVISIISPPFAPLTSRIGTPTTIFPISNR